MSTVTRTSRRVAAALRHDTTIARTVEGWVRVTDVLRHLKITRAELAEVIAASSRYELDSHGLRIRAKYGHSIPTLTGETATPPPVLYHGTRWDNLAAILRDGLRPMRRQAVHLHTDPDVARRRGAALLIVDARAAHDQGHLFVDASNGVWLTDSVPSEYISRAN